MKKNTVKTIITIVTILFIVSSAAHAIMTCGAEEMTCTMPGYALKIQNNGGHGILGYSLKYNGKGVMGRSDKDTGIGVFGLNPKASGTTYGVYGSANSPDGYGVYGENTGDGYAGYFEGDAVVTGNLYVDGIVSTEFSGSTVPIGAVIDWWRPDSSFPMPPGYQIADGSTVTDADSPLNGKTLPDLTDRFVVGVTDVSDIGVTGGSSNHSHDVNIDHDHSSANSSSTGSHSHSVDPSPVTSSSSGSHLHTINVPNYLSTRTSTAAGSHKHKWITFRGSNNSIHSWGSNGVLREMIDWGDGLDNEGSGIWPIAIDYFGFTWDWSLYTDTAASHAHSTSISHDHPSFSSVSAGSHNHSVDIPSVTSGSTGSHSHSVNLPSLGTQNKASSIKSNIPPYYGLLKIVRIK